MSITLFRDCFSRLPDLAKPPEGKFLKGDICKVKGRPMAYTGDRTGWVDMESLEPDAVERATGRPS